MSESTPAIHRRQVLLIPQKQYWGWVRAARDYCVRFGVTMTPDRLSATRSPDDDLVITLIDFPGAWPDTIRSWFRKEYPQVSLDVIEVQSPVELHQVLEDRLVADDRFGTNRRHLILEWPTAYPVVTQPFGANPHYYRRFGLPGHEGVDFRATTHTPIYACADGWVYRVENRPIGQAYGIHVRIRHAGGYKTVYAHLQSALVEENQNVRAGDQIGWADSTGNSSGSHLHLSLKKEGATVRGETIYPHDIIDPTPFLRWPSESVAANFDQWEPGICLVGVHGRADGPLVEADYPAIRTARLEAIKLIVNAQPANVDRIRSINPDCFLLARLFADFRDGRKVTAREFAEWQIADLQRLYDKGVRYFEVHNEPNLVLEGFGANWRNGDSFEAWFIEVVEILATHFPQAKFGFPGCSPGKDAIGVRQDMWRFLEQCDGAIERADWVGVHCYWQDRAELLSLDGGMGFVKYRQHWPNKLIFITEFSNPSTQVPSATKGRQYIEYLKILRQRSGIGAAFGFVLSASTGVENEVWRKADGSLTPIPEIIGNRDF